MEVMYRRFLLSGGQSDAVVSRVRLSESRFFGEVIFINRLQGIYEMNCSRKPIKAGAETASAFCRKERRVTQTQL